MRWRPSGSPGCRARRDRIAGSPARLAGTANTSLKYIASGSLIFSLSPNAAEGAVGVRMKSHSAKALVKSRLIRVRTFCALVK